MPKTITSPVKHFPGTVTLSDPLTFPQTFAFEDATEVSQKLGKDASFNRHLHALLPGILACVENWDIKGIANPTPGTFPSTPSAAVIDLLTWLVNEITILYQEAVEIPNA